MASTVLAREKFADFIDEAEPILRRHWREVAHYTDIPLNVDRSNYERIEQADMLRIFTARLGRTLIGYAVFLISPNAHYRYSIQAKQDVIYIAPEHRGRLAGYRLIKFADEMLRAEGAQVVYQHVKLSHPALGRILERIGYAPIETIYARRLDKNIQRAGVAPALGGEDANARAAELANEIDVRHVPSETCH